METNTTEFDPRSYPRIECELTAHLASDGKHLADCIISDISAFGCRIYLDAVISLPPSFEIHSDVFEQPMIASVKWQGPDVIGAGFAVAKPVDVPLPPRFRLPG